MTGPRIAATAAAAAAMDATEQNVLGRNIAWQIVNAALDAYEAEAMRSLGSGTAYAVMCIDPGETVSVLPTYSIAKRHLKQRAKEAGRKRNEYAVLLVNTYLSR